MPRTVRETALYFILVAVSPPCYCAPHRTYTQHAAIHPRDSLYLALHPNVLFPHFIRVLNCMRKNAMTRDYRLTGSKTSSLLRREGYAFGGSMRPSYGAMLTM